MTISPSTPAGQEELFRLLVAGVVDYAIITLDPDGNVTSWNPGAQRIKGWTAAQIVGRSFRTFYPAEDLARGKTEMELREAAARGSFEDEGWRVRADGSRFWANVVITAMRDDSGRLVGFSKLTRDMTERRAGEQAVRDVNAELERRVAERTALLSAINEELEAFTYSVSHDLRAPLRAIDGFVSIVRAEHEEAIPEEARQLLAEVTANARQMGRLIDDLLSFSRLHHTDIGSALVRSQPLVARLVDRVVGANADRALDVRIGELPDCFGDEVLLTQVFTNLLENAAKYTRDQVAPVIRIRGWVTDGGGTSFEVSDNGTGFEQEYAGKLFRVFQRLHRSEEYEGTGVGLAIVKRIVTRHGGTVWATGLPGAGATFGFSLAAGPSPSPGLPTSAGTA